MPKASLNIIIAIFEMNALPISSFNSASLRLDVWLSDSELRKNDLIFSEIARVSLKIPS
jgi:hypothetical protein